MFYIVFVMPISKKSENFLLVGWGCWITAGFPTLVPCTALPATCPGVPPLVFPRATTCLLARKALDEQ